MEESRHKGAPTEPPGVHTDIDDPPGKHLRHKLRERALDGFYVDIFEFVEPDSEAGSTGSRKDAKCKPETPRDRSVANWLWGYTEYMALIAAAYPERGWHLCCHLSHVLEARAMVGELAAMVYDQAFHKTPVLDRT